MSSTDSGGVKLNPKPKATQIEHFGIGTIPDADRTSTPFDLFRIQFGGANTFATVLLGTFPILLGLSFWEGVAATLLGLFVGTFFLMPMGLFGPKTGTNNAVSSSAHFGVRGRVAGSFLSLLTAVAFYSISVWVGGDALVGGLVRLFAVEDTPLLRAFVYGLIGAIVIIVVIFGYQFMLLVNKTAVIANSFLMILAVFAFSGTFDAGYAGGEYALGSFLPTFILSALIVMSNPISFGAFLGDWSRYIPKNTKTSSLLGATFLGQLATLIPFLFGVATATLVAGDADYIVSLIQISPLWYAILLMVIAFIGGLSTGTTSLYGTGLDFSSVFPRLSRAQATIAIGSVAFIFILGGRLYFDLLGSVNAFIGAIIVTTTPWMVIMTIGYFVRRGHYESVDLQVFNERKKGGRYWFQSGINWRGMVAWVVAAVLGLQFAYFPPVIEGALSGVAGGIDLSLIVAISTAAILYIAALVIFPEPSYVYGPKGPRLVRARQAPVPPITK